MAKQPPPAVAEWGPQEEVVAGKACKKSSKKYPPVGGMYWRAARATSVRARWRASRAASTAIQRAPAVAERGGEEEVVAGYVILFRIRNCSALGPQTIVYIMHSLLTRHTSIDAWEQCNHTRKTELNRYLVHALEQPPICMRFKKISRGRGAPAQ